MKRILLMDDEQVVLDFLGQILRHLGYDVATTTAGAQAIDAYVREKSEAKPFDVVIMDLVIANGMGGQETVAELKKIDPTARAIATSGHLDHPVMVDHRAFHFDATLPKPYKMDRLKEVIEGVINASA